MKLCVLCFLCVAAEACHRGAVSPLVAQTAGTIDAAVSAPVRIVRDRWGIPHIYAETQGDLFFAQGFVQAQDRLFQMDLWRRSAQGRLSEILGPNFIERDGMTRRMQFVGDLDAEWASYGPDAKAIASAFVGGVNAWVEIAQARPTEEFLLAGWRPEFWSPPDLLNRTDAFVESGDAVDEVGRRQLSPVVAEAIRRVGTKPFLAGARTAGGTLDVPSPRYLVQLNAPGWNVAGATAPWRPGVAAGRNDRMTWDIQPAALDTQDVYVEPAGMPARVLEDAIRVKGRDKVFAFNREFTGHGVIVASDRERQTVYTVRWSGFEPGGAPELAALALDRARSAAEFRETLAHWRMPARRFIYSVIDGGVPEFQDAGLVPIRKAGEWSGWQTLDDLPHGREQRGTSNERRATSNEQQVPSPQSPVPVMFSHVLATSDALRQRFNIGPLKPGGGSPAVSVPGQSESPFSVHFSDLARMWERGETAPLAFSDAEVRANTESTLTLMPRRN